MNILIVKLSAIGDVIHTLPALNAIRRHHPDAHITWVVEEAAYPLIEGHGALDRVLVSKRKHWIKKLVGSDTPSSEKRAVLKDAYLFIKVLRDTRYDLVIDFQQLLKSGILVALSGGKRKAGYNKGMEHQEHSHLFLNERIPPVKMDIHALLRSMMLIEALGILSDDIVFDLPIRDQDRSRITDLLARNGQLTRVSGKPLVAVNPMAKWKTKLWSDMKFSRLADQLIEQYGASVVFTGGPEDREAVQGILSGMKRSAVNFAGKTSLKMLAALYEKTDFLVTTDTGPMHLAAAVGIPVVAIFGPTAPWRTGPFGSGHQVIRAGLKCSPCFKRQCQTTECMKRIRVEDVLKGIRKLPIIKKLKVKS
ncbi:MAG: lipopolysaccharide heptosyltransferase I [Deltaproteobacteria bacterium]|nr:MAG: lipopolysaccharide heptosyltransferase I [Deltaproteobacteria bacterium]